jgi:hypothetical protein
MNYCFKVLSQLNIPDCLNFISPCGLGDTMVLCAGRRVLEQKYHTSIHLIIKPTHEIVMEMYNNTHYSIREFTKNELWDIAQDNYVPQKGKLYVAHPIYSDNTGLMSSWAKADFDINCLWRQFLQIDSSIQFDLPVYYPNFTSTMYNSIGIPANDINKTVLLLPEARSVPALRTKYWVGLSKNLRREGYFVVQNYVNKIFKIKDVPCLPDDLKLVLAFSLSCNKVYSLRSGLCDLIAEKVKDLTVFYPDKFSYKVYQMRTRFPKQNIANIFVPASNSKKIKQIIKHLPFVTCILKKLERRKNGNRVGIRRYGKC